MADGVAGGADVSALAEGVAQVAVSKPANHAMPPGRVRHLFKVLDTDKSGGLDMDELLTGFAKELKVDELALHVKEAMEKAMEKVGEVDERGTKVIKCAYSLFSRSEPPEMRACAIATGAPRALPLLTVSGRQPTPAQDKTLLSILL